MRLLMKKLKPVYVFEMRERDSGYVGTETVPVYKRRVMCNVQPAESKITVEMYGERVKDMKRVICADLGAILPHMQVSFTDNTKPTHNILSVPEYSDHTWILAEVLP
jgi:hypothetical protein